MVEKNQYALGLKRGESSNFLVAEKYKPYKIYRRMYYVYGELCFSLKKFF